MTFIAPFAFAFVVLMFTAMQPGAAAAPAAGRGAAGAVTVTIHYKGKGAVDGSHRLWVWLFTTPDIGPQSMPIAELSIDKNGGQATFESVAAERVWIAVAFDESGTMTGQAPPPTGSPVAIYVGSDGAPRGVVPGDSTAAVLTFDDSQRMP